MFLYACVLAGVELERFSAAMLSRTIDVEGERLKVPLSLEQVRE